MESYQFPPHQLGLPLVLLRDPIPDFESVDLEPIPQSVLWDLLNLFCHKVGCVKCTNSAIINVYTAVQPDRRADVSGGKA